MWARTDPDPLATPDAPQLSDAPATLGAGADAVLFVGCCVEGLGAGVKVFGD